MPLMSPHDEGTPANGFAAVGTLYNSNTFEDFKAMDVPGMAEVRALYSAVWHPAQYQILCPC